MDNENSIYDRFRSRNFRAEISNLPLVLIFIGAVCLCLQSAAADYSFDFPILENDEFWSQDLEHPNFDVTPSGTSSFADNFNRPNRYPRENYQRLATFEVPKNSSEVSINVTHKGKFDGLLICFSQHTYLSLKPELPVIEGLKNSRQVFAYSHHGQLSNSGPSGDHLAHSWESSEDPHVGASCHVYEKFRKSKGQPRRTHDIVDLRGLFHGIAIGGGRLTGIQIKRITLNLDARPSAHFPTQSFKRGELIKVYGYQSRKD